MVDLLMSTTKMCEWEHLCSKHYWNVGKLLSSNLAQQPTRHPFSIRKCIFFVYDMFKSLTRFIHMRSVYSVWLWIRKQSAYLLQWDQRRIKRRDCRILRAQSQKWRLAPEWQSGSSLRISPTAPYPDKKQATGEILGSHGDESEDGGFLKCSNL